MATSRVRTELEFSVRVIVDGDAPLSAEERAKLDRVRSLIQEIGGANVAFASTPGGRRSPMLAAVPLDVLDRNAVPLTPGRRVLCRCGLEVEIGNPWAVARHRHRCLFGLAALEPGVILCGSSIRPHTSARVQVPRVCTRLRGHERDAHEVLRACMDGRLLARNGKREPPTWTLDIATLPAEAPVFGGES